MLSEPRYELNLPKPPFVSEVKFSDEFGLYTTTTTLGPRLRFSRSVWLGARGARSFRLKLDTGLYVHRVGGYRLGYCRRYWFHCKR